MSLCLRSDLTSADGAESFGASHLKLRFNISTHRVLIVLKTVLPDQRKSTTEVA
jgi:hypothetical protein